MTGWEFEMRIYSAEMKADPSRKVCSFTPHEVFYHRQNGRDLLPLQ
jgi:hypothetical protein